MSILPRSPIGLEEGGRTKVRLAAACRRQDPGSGDDDPFVARRSRGGLPRGPWRRRRGRVGGDDEVGGGVAGRRQAWRSIFAKSLARAFLGASSEADLAGRVNQISINTGGLHPHFGRRAAACKYPCPHMSEDI